VQVQVTATALIVSCIKKKRHFYEIDQKKAPTESKRGTGSPINRTRVYG